MINEPTLFDSLINERTKEEAKLPESDNASNAKRLTPEEIQYKEKVMQCNVESKGIEINPDDLTVIRILIEKEAYRDDEDCREAAEQYVDKQMEGKFDIYNDNPDDIDKMREWACNKVTALFYDIQQTLLDVLYICASEMQSISINPNTDNADYIAYLYNVNAPFHNRKPIHYRKLIDTLNACCK